MDSPLQRKLSVNNSWSAYKNTRLRRFFPIYRSLSKATYWLIGQESLNEFTQKQGIFRNQWKSSTYMWVNITYFIFKPMWKNIKPPRIEVTPVSLLRHVFLQMICKRILCVEHALTDWTTNTWLQMTILMNSACRFRVEYVSTEAAFEIFSFCAAIVKSYGILVLQCMKLL